MLSHLKRAHSFRRIIAIVILLQLPLSNAGQAAVPALQQPAQTAQSAPAAPEQPPLKPFAEVVKEAEVLRGLFTLYRKDDKVYLELLPEQFDQPYLLSPTMETGIGERDFYGGNYFNGDEFLISFHRLGKNVQLIKKNVHYRAPENTPTGRAVQHSFADSVLATTAFESQPHPERRSVLINLGQLLLTDLLQIGYLLEAEYKLPYKLDARNCELTQVKTFPRNTELGVVLNFAIDRLPVAPLMPTPVPLPVPPAAVPDYRSLQFNLRYSLAALPDNGYRPRIADDRVGHWVTQYKDHTDDTRETSYVRYIGRWRLEKAEPNAPLSAPKQPIVYWLENTIPVQYRAAITKGVLLWNKAFERIGYKDAIVVKQQPDKADWDPADSRYNTIRWMNSTDTGWLGYGPSRMNPLTGEIYDADIKIDGTAVHDVKRYWPEYVQPSSSSSNGFTRALARDGRRQCDFGAEAAQQLSFGFGLLKTRGLLDDAASEERYVNEALTELAAHEVGHTLGLRHNFTASRSLPFDKLHDMALTTEQGLSASVMDYIPVNLAPKGVKQGHYDSVTLGAYDYWAIEYAYKPIAADSPEAELPELRRMASQAAARPELAFGTDENANGYDGPFDMDPRVTRFDLSDDPLRFDESEAKLVHELWANLETKVAKPGDGYQVMQRAFDTGLRMLGRYMLGASKYIGGINHNRDHVGDPGQRLPYEPVPAAEQRRALALLNQYLFGVKSFDFSPSLLNKLASEHFETFEQAGQPVTGLDYPLHQRVLGIQTRVLDRFFHPVLLNRMHDLEAKYPKPQQAFTLADLFQGLHEAIWSELKASSGHAEINSFRRDLQREHLKRLTRLVLRPAPNTPEDATTLARYSLTQLHTEVQRALARGAASSTVTTRAHLQETLARIDETLKAQQQRVVN